MAVRWLSCRRVHLVQLEDESQPLLRRLRLSRAALRAWAPVLVGDDAEVEGIITAIVGGVVHVTRRAAMTDSARYLAGIRLLRACGCRCAVLRWDGAAAVPASGCTVAPTSATCPFASDPVQTSAP